MLKMQLDAETLRPIVAEIVRQVITELGADDGRIAYSEKEAARMLGLAPHQLRDRRLEGKVKATKIGREYRYTRSALIEMLETKQEKTP